MKTVVIYSALQAVISFSARDKSHDLTANSQKLEDMKTTNMEPTKIFFVILITDYEHGNSKG